MKKIISLVVFILLVVIVLYLQMGRDVYVCSTRTYTVNDEVEEDVTLCANKLFIIDKNNFAEKIVKRYNENSFKEVLFSKDMGEVKKVKFSVYLNRWERKCADKSFEIYYMEDTENTYFLVK